MIVHFTREFEHLCSILSSRSFRLSYCGEYFGDKTGKVISRAAHPMVSFSDYSDVELLTKVVTYGGYGVALTKNWALNQGLSPVNYVEKNSPAAQGLVSLLKARQRKIIPSTLRLPIIQLKCFTKHVYGFNSYFNESNFDFKAENEWRFVPSRKQIGGNRISENFSTYDKNRDKYNKRLEKYPLRFSYSDVAFVYVKTEPERQRILTLAHLPECKVKLKRWKEKT
ncbi:abortive infection system antitoxin AbiGi family protein [Microbulbifer sp. JMSA002]|uniref:abortive infection system antitoxin AbiGi family protein n=1 Tax=Microbulbifer sp. JMSA002 TaxID=3243368 RepID=UPI00403A08F2